MQVQTRKHIYTPEKYLELEEKALYKDAKNMKYFTRLPFEVLLQGYIMIFSSILRKINVA